MLGWGGRAPGAAPAPCGGGGAATPVGRRLRLCSVHLDGAAQELSRTEDVRLAGVFLKRARPHACRKRCIGGQNGWPVVLPEKIIHSLTISGAHLAGKAPRRRFIVKA
jgi:hypothetical protein